MPQYSGRLFVVSARTIKRSSSFQADLERAEKDLMEDKKVGTLSGRERVQLWE